MFAPGPVSGSAVGSGVLETEADFEADLVIGSIPAPAPSICYFDGAEVLPRNLIMLAQNRSVARALACAVPPSSALVKKG